MKHTNRLWAKIVAAVIVGFLFAGATTKITYDCDPTGDAKGCISFEKAVMNPNDLARNKQDSLVTFTTTFAVSFLITFTLLSALGKRDKNKK